MASKKGKGVNLIYDKDAGKEEKNDGEMLIWDGYQCWSVEDNVNVPEKVRMETPEIVRWVERRNDKLVIGKDESFLEDVERLIELAFLVEAINGYELTKRCKKREMNSQKRAVRRIMMGMKPFKKMKCVKNNWLCIPMKKLDPRLIENEVEKIEKDSQKIWLWMKRKKKYWIMNVVFNKPPDLNLLMERLRLIKWKGKKHKEAEEVNTEIDIGNVLEHDFKTNMIKCCEKQSQKRKNKWNNKGSDARKKPDETTVNLKGNMNPICCLCDNNLNYGVKPVNCNTQKLAWRNRTWKNKRVSKLNSMNWMINGKKMICM
jgi:hypothetical protein